MREHIRNMGVKYRQWRVRLAQRLAKLDRAAWSRAGYYAALIALLAILGAASHAYRARRDTVEATPSQPPRAAAAIGAPVTPSPEPTIEPARWEWPLRGEIIGAYEPDAPVWSKTLEQWQTHAGVDIAGAPGEAVLACRDGVVADAWSDRLWGNVIVIDHGDGYRSTYANLNTLKLVEPGDAVTAGEVISAVGQSAACEGEMGWHLHFELTQNGEPLDFTALAERDDAY